MQRFVRDTVATRPDQTLIGICWGHQVIHKALGKGGGSHRLLQVQVGHELTPAGKEFFPNTTNEGILAINTMHHTEVLEPAPGFQVLLARNEACLSANKNILTIQAHPEIGPIFAEELVRQHFEKDLADGVMDEWLRKLNGVLDNGLVWQRIVQWTETPADRR
ncbi:Copper iron-regulated glutamine amidotransferase [Fusarium agapanthi]|uniref:Copper iron-regulated glutamine amidotransferase n=1 Tax=Fusarium agapanthi TaxID=1803897 RepID=A0A9P5B206_9HYPO|nr:Copper iron-regulated glutamine amidotransferase [Fusarium agapanthi]